MEFKKNPFEPEAFENIVFFPTDTIIHGPSTAIFPGIKSHIVTDDKCRPTKVRFLRNSIIFRGCLGASLMKLSEVKIILKKE